MSQQKTALVSGATSGIGRRVAADLAEAGWEVIALGRRAAELESLAASAPRPGAIRTHQVDLTSFPLPADLVGDRVDAVVHAAGLVPTGSLADTTHQDWQYAFALNVTAGAELVRQALPALRRSAGTIVFINSGAGVTLVPRNPLYGATKHALRAFANGLRAAEEGYGVRVASIFPGPTDTELFTAEVDRAELISAESVAKAVVQAITAPADVQLTEIQVRPRRELTW